MGITIFYHGQLADTGRLPLLTAQIHAACEQLGWRYFDVNERILGVAERFKTTVVRVMGDGIEDSEFELDEVPVDDHVRGVIVAPPESESVFLTCGRNGHMIYYGSRPDESTPGHYGLIQDHLWTKTQFSSPQVHMRVCDLLRIVEPFMASFEVMDEGEYHHTRDEQTLLRTWWRYTQILNHMADQKMMQSVLGSAGLDIEMTKPPAVGYEIAVVQPLWRQDWGISANEN